jgi:hypothetical protein
MATVSYHSQPGIHQTRGAVPLDGTKAVYTVGKQLWPQEVEQWLAARLIGKTLHVCCGKSRLGNVRLDMFQSDVDVRGDAARLPFWDKTFDTVLADPPYSGQFQWNHDMLNELHRVASQRIIFQHWFSPVNRLGHFKKAYAFKATEAALAPYLEDEGAVVLVNTDDGPVMVREENSDYFTAVETAAWNPRSYFGRVQVITVMDRQ